jgi:hypothetical protein
MTRLISVFAVVVMAFGLSATAASAHPVPPHYVCDYVPRTGPIPAHYECSYVPGHK